VPGALYEGPLAVLVDRERLRDGDLAAAIHDYRRGAILGEHTYGKGTVQETVDLNENESDPPTFGQLVLTTAEYFRVTGKSTQLAGVEIDLELPPWPGAGEYGERFEANPLPAGEVPAQRFAPIAGAVLVTPSARALHAERLQRDPALSAVLAAASRRAAPPADAELSLNEKKRRAPSSSGSRPMTPRSRMRWSRPSPRLTTTRTRAIRRKCCGALMLLEAERVLADSIRAGHTGEP
jgi:carboxyl-terminal processing protease